MKLTFSFVLTLFLKWNELMRETLENACTILAVGISVWKF